MPTIMDAASRADPPDDLFKGINFAVIKSEDLDEDAAKKVTGQLLSYGAIQYSISSQYLQDITHIIATSIDFPAYNDAIDAYINVVKPVWVEHAILKRHTPNTRQYSPDPCLYLSDVVVTCSDEIPEGDKEAILGGVIAGGGQYSPVLSKLVTHVVTLTLENPQCQLMIQRNLKCSPVLPHWFSDCLKLGKRIDVKPYLLPRPQILHRVLNSPVAWRNSNDIHGAVTPMPADSDVPQSPSKSRRAFNVLKNQAVYLANDLKLSNDIRNTIEIILEDGGALITDDIRQANTLICRYRSGEAYKIASRAGLDVGSLSWLYYLINRNAYIAPTRRLLHYPIPMDGIEGFQNCVISVSNFTGEARLYLENLVKAVGGIFTKTMTQTNTHLITAHKVSKKCDAAKEWDIHIVNHLWLEESYAKCKMQSLTNTRYTHFPQRTNLEEVLGRTQIDRDAVERFYYTLPHGSPVTHGQLEIRSPNSAERRLYRSTGGSPTPKTFKSPLEREEDIMTSGRRAAKTRAVEKLRDQVSDIALFEKESKRTGGVVYGGRRVTDTDRIRIHPSVSGRKRNSDGQPAASANEPSNEVDSEDGEGEAKTPLRKKARATQAIPSTERLKVPLKVLVTGYERWTKMSNETEDKARLKALGIIVTDKVGNHDLLAAPQMRRTVKFVAGIATARHVLHVNWLERCIQKGEMVPDEDFVLVDSEWEEKHTTSVPEVMERAKLHREQKGMLKGWTIFCTEGVNGGSEPYSDIVAANKGRFMVWKGRKTELREAKDCVPRAGQATREVFLVTEECDSSLWEKFRSMATAQEWRPRIVRPEWLLTIATCQDVDRWDEEWLLVQDDEN